MVYVTGDLHGDPTRLKESGIKKLRRDDTLLVCGDFGFLWDGSKAEQAMLKKLGKCRFHICFVDGVHENFELLHQYPIGQWNGGRARQISGRLYHLMRGEIYTIEGKTYFTMGGGVSSDDDFRSVDETRMRHEIPSREELEHAAANLERVNGQLDYIITHEPPMRIKAFLQLKKQSRDTVEYTGLNTFFEEIAKCCKFTCWYFGSMHMDKFISSAHTAVFRKVIPVAQKK